MIGLKEALEATRTPQRGVFPLVEQTPRGRRIRLAPWTEASIRPMKKGAPEEWDPAANGAVYEVPQSQVEALHAGLPQEIRRTAREKYKELVKRLYADANAMFYKDGVIRWPRSIEREIQVLGIAQGKPDLAKQVEALARRYIEKGARTQQAQDRKRVTRDWSGHLSA